MVLYVDLYVWLLLEIIVAVADLEQIPAPVLCTEVEPTNSEMVTGIVKDAWQQYKLCLPHRHIYLLLHRRRQSEKGSFTRCLRSSMHSCCRLPHDGLRFYGVQLYSRGEK